jgi:hypothetical protein
MQVVGTHLNLAAECADVAASHLALGGGVEVAVDAARLAEWDVYVDACHGQYLFAAKILTIFLIYLSFSRLFYPNR